MKNEKKPDVEAVALRLSHELGPYATRFAEHALETRMCDESALEELLTEEWGGAVPDSFISTEEASRSLMNVLHMFLDFAVKEAIERKSCSPRDFNISYYAEPYYDDSSAVLVVDRETKTLLCKRYIKTYRLDKDGVERFLKGLVKDICNGIDLSRKRKNRGENLWEQEDV